MSTREFDDIIKQKAQRRQADVPPDIWENIANRKKKRRKPFFWLIFLALLAGGGATVWKIKNSNNDMAVVVEKTKAEKGETPIDESNSNQSSASNKIKSSDANEGDNKTTSQPINDLSTSNDVVAEKRKAISPLSKKPPTTNIFIANGKEKTFVPTLYKRKTNGKYKATVENAYAGELAGNGNTKNIIDADEVQPRKTEKSNSENTLDTVNSLADVSVASVIDKKKKNIAAETIADSLDTKKITQPDKSNIDKKETAIKTPTRKQKNTSLKIEAKATLLFPVQQYEQPQAVQRVLNTASNSASFASTKNIVSTIESGNGFSISLIKQLNNKWSVGAGISFMRFTEQLQLHGNETNNEYYIVQRLKEGPNGSYLAPDTLSNSTTYNTTLFGRNIYHNAGIPLFARYRFIAGKKLSCEFTTGFTMNLLRKYSNNIPGEFTTVYADGSKQTGMKNSIGIDVFAGLLVSGRLYRKYEWFAATDYVYNLSAYKTLVNKKIHLPGVSVGVLYELRK